MTERPYESGDAIRADAQAHAKISSLIPGLKIVTNTQSYVSVGQRQLYERRAMERVLGD